MENILLCNSGVWTECGVIKLTSKIGIYSSLHPYVNWEGFEVSEAEKGGAGGNFVAYSFDRL